MTAISSPTSWSDYTTLATPASKSSISIADLSGATLNGDKINNKYIMIGVSEYSTANLTEAGQQLILNSVYYILGIDPTGIISVNANDNDNLNDNVNSQTFNLAGQRVSDGYKGIVICNGKKIVK